MKIFDKFLTILRPAAERPAAEVARPSGKQKPSPKRDRMPKDKSKIGIGTIKCPYCFSQKFTRRGFRQKKHERVQLYLCQECGRTFTAHLTKGKHYPLPIIFQAISLYNLGYSLEKTCEIVNKRCLENSQFSSTNFQSNTLLADAAHQALQAGNDSMIKRKKSIENSKISRACFLASSKIENSLKTENCKLKIIHPSSLSTWLAEFTDLCRFSRMREFAIKDFSPEEMVITATLAHQQLFRYRFHQAKCKLMIQEEFQHRKFIALKEFLEMVPVECPHQYFMKPASTRGESTRGGGLRASEAPMTFSKKQMIVRAKQNYATRLCEFVLQSVKQRKQRHNALQKFMLYNDSVTVATEVPVYLTKDDLLHLQTQLGFEIYQKKLKTKNEKLKTTTKNLKLFEDSNLPKLITGHIDILQIRNGQIHILDYKPKAEKGQPIEQLTLYAMALSRLTGLRLFEFKCAWFDENDYFEFYPLHALHKPRKGRRRRKVYTMEGIYEINRKADKIEKIRPTI